MNEESKKDFHFFPYMYDYEKTIRAILNAVDTDEVDKIAAHFTESVSALYLRRDILKGLYTELIRELADKNFEELSKIKRAIEIIENYLASN
jgi:hypothetical protein